MSSDGLQLNALAASAASCFTGTPAEFQEVTIDDDGHPVVEYRHTSLDGDTLESVVSGLAGRLAATLATLDLEVDRIGVVGYSPVDPDKEALKYHIRREWATDAVTRGDEAAAAELLEKIGEHAEDFVEVGEGS